MSLKINDVAPNFSLADAHGNQVSLESYRGEKNVFLVFNRGFS